MSDEDFFAPVLPQKKRGPKPKGNRAKLIPVSFKMSELDHAKMTAKANRHAKGNVSAWLRESSTMYYPPGGTVS